MRNTVIDYLYDALAIGGAIWFIVTLIFYPVNPLILSSSFLFITVSLSLIQILRKQNVSKVDQALVAVFMIINVGTFLYVITQLDTLIYRSAFPTMNDAVVGLLFLIVLMEICRRRTGWVIPTFMTIVVLYAFWGHHLPGILQHSGFSFQRLMGFIFGPEGIYGMPVSVTLRYVMIFILFGAAYEKAGGDTFIIELAKALAGRTAGGAAKIAVLASALFGSINGNPTANVMATGVLTIPLMKKSGFNAKYAGAVEATASTGGQILPPIMGAAAFLMAEFTATPYYSLILIAAIPAILFFVSVFWMVHLEAKKQNLKPMPAEEIPSLKEVLRNHGHLLIPIIVIVVTLVFMRVSPLRSAFYGLVSIVAVSWFKKHTGLGFREIADALKSGMEGVLLIAALTGVVGSLIAVLGLTGITISFGNMLMEFSGGILYLALPLGMLVTMVMGMGMPTTAAYLVGASVIAPALVKLGIGIIPAHFFILYYANFSNITPPVAFAAYAGASISKSSPMQVAVQAMQLGSLGLLIPYFFVFSPGLLLIGSTAEILIATLTSFVGIFALGIGIVGVFFTKIKMWVRLLLSFGALLMLHQNLYTDFIGFCIIIVLLITVVWQQKKGLVESI